MEPMKKQILLAALVVFGLAGCASFWAALSDEGTNFDNYVASHGVPVSSYKMQNGDMAYSFRRACSYVQGFEESVVIVGPDNLIKSVSKTQYCPSVPTSSKKSK